jgi:hypothetical protein
MTKELTGENAMCKIRIRISRNYDQGEDPMKTIIGAVCAGLALMALTPAQAWANPQHERMKRCNAEAKEQALKGDERKAFMSTCLRGAHAASATKDTAAAPAAVQVEAVEEGMGTAQKTTAAAAATTVAAVDAGAMDQKALKKACNQSATEQSLRGEKRKTFIAECMKG